MRIFIYIALAILSLPLLIVTFFVAAFWDETAHANEITELVRLSELTLRDDYFCHEGKCFGTFEVSDDHEVDFFISRKIAERVIKHSEILGENWSLARELCNNVTFRDGKEVCQIGGKIMSYSEYQQEQNSVQ